MKQPNEFNATSDLHNELEHACQIALATIHYTFNDCKDTEFVSEDEIDKVHHALMCLDLGMKLKANCKFTV